MEQNEPKWAKNGSNGSMKLNGLKWTINGNKWTRPCTITYLMDHFSKWIRMKLFQLDPIIIKILDEEQD